MPEEGAVDEICAWRQQQKPVMGESYERQDRRIRAAIGSASTIAMVNTAVSAKPGPLYWSGQQPQSR